MILTKPSLIFLNGIPSDIMSQICIRSTPTWNQSDIYDLLHWVVSNTYVHNGDLTIHQTVGLPMVPMQLLCSLTLGCIATKGTLSRVTRMTQWYHLQQRHKVYWWYSLDWPIIASINTLSQHLMILTLSTQYLQLSQTSASTTEVGYTPSNKTEDASSKQPHRPHRLGDLSTWLVLLLSHL